MPKIFQTIKLRRNTAQKWTENNPILQAGEPGFESDSKRLKIGDGITDWLNLAYASGVQSAATKLSQLEDIGVELDIVDNELLSYNSQSAKWANKSIGELGLPLLESSANSFAGIISAKNYELQVATASSDNMQLNFSSGEGIVKRTMSADVVFGGNSYKAGTTKTVFLFNNTGLTKNVSFPAGWKFIGGKPITIPDAKVCVLTVTSLGILESECIAGWSSS